jgi:hypothetical protein
MTRPIGAAVAAAALALAGCPIPQPLPDYPPGTITPPRIVVDDSFSQIASPEVVVQVAAGCPAGHHPSFPLDAQIRDAITDEPIEVRWFVNYDAATLPGRTWEQQEIIRTADPGDPTLRDIAPFTFPPYDFLAMVPKDAPGSAVGSVHVVELVVSNRFYTGDGERLPNRSPAPGFEVQVYRWVFLNVPESTGCSAGEPGCVLCPP